MKPDPAVADLESFLAERGEPLLRTAVLLAGSKEAGEDLLQAALERVLRKPRQVDWDMEGYLRRVLYNLAADGWRRRGRWRKKLPLLRSEAILAAADDTAVVDGRDVLVRLVLQLPPRQRAVIVLRYWEQEFPQLKPVKRRGNRRYYQRQDVIIIRQIRSLLYEQGFTIGGARNTLGGEEARVDVSQSQQIMKQMRVELEELLRLLRR